jgi:tetratricopeptide (TPR) repeat protein
MAIGMPAHRFAILAAIAFFGVFCANASAQTQQQHDWCYDPNATDPQTIDGCTALVSSNSYHGRELAIILYDRGLSYENTKQYTPALVDISQAIALDPNYSDAINERGNVFVKTKQYDLGLKDYDEAIRLKPDFALAYGNRGYTYYLMNNMDRALDDLNRAIGIEPTAGRMYVNRALIRIAKKDCTGAAQDLQSARRMNWNYTVSADARAACGAALADFLPNAGTPAVK